MCRENSIKVFIDLIKVKRGFMGRKVRNNIEERGAVVVLSRFFLVNWFLVR